MKKPGVLLLSMLCISNAAWAAPRKHHPWFSHKVIENKPPPAVDVTPTSHSLQAIGRDSPPAVRGTKVGVQSSHEVLDPGFRRDDGARRVRETRADPGCKVVQQAMRYKGTRYKFGGTSTKGMDCSGLVARVWEDLKMKKIPRVSSALFNSGRPVRLSELKPGDLVFFKNTYKSGISHVGVYTGNNKFIHAANKHLGVTTAKLSDPYYQLHYAGARRLY
jgi:cell wall-associated NlpC family hydrolase